MTIPFRAGCRFARRASPLLATFWLCLPQSSLAAFSAASYFPLRDDVYWTYSDDTTTTVIGTTVINGTPTKELRDNFGDSEFYSNDSQGVMLHRVVVTGIDAGTVNFQPPIDVAKAQVNVGDRLDSSGTANFTVPGYGTYGLSYTAVARVPATEQVTVPYGSFNAVKLVLTLRIYGSVEGDPIDESTTQTLWLANGIGAVKGDDGPPDYTVWGLVDTNVVGTGCYAVNGTAGSDTLPGTAGKDCIDGKAGADTMYGLAADDTYTVDNSGDTVIEGAGEGTDTISSSVTYSLPIYVENLVLTGTSAINGNGNGLNNSITGSAANNVLNGKGGVDTLSGKTGNDTYYVDNTSDKVVEGVDQGTDTVRSTVTHTLRPNVENLVLTGTANTTGTGNTLDNRITGSAANQILTGGLGNDTLTGGPGPDRFLFKTALSSSTNVDRITDFVPVDDTIRLDDAVFTALSPGTLPAAAFRIGSSATTAAHCIMYSPGNGAVLYDADGTGPVAPVRFATLPTGLAVTNTDFYVQ